MGIKMEKCLNSHSLCSGQRPSFCVQTHGDVFRMPTSSVADIIRSCLHFNSFTRKTAQNWYVIGYN